MWKLLFSERKYTPLPFSWHLWHLFVATLPAAGVVWYFSRVKRKMELIRVGNEAIAGSLKEQKQAEEEEKEAELRMLGKRSMRTHSRLVSPSFLS
jgi:hypothetical protein